MTPSFVIPPSRVTPEPLAEPIVRFRDENRFLSNFWFVPGGVTWQNLTGPTTEHVFQAAKVLDPAAQRAVLAAPTAKEAKFFGQQVPLRPDWDAVKLGVMATLQASKFQNPDLAAQLRATGDAELVEGNHWCDTFWGRCTCRVHEATDLGGQGKNWLGSILMIQRSFLLA